MSDLIAHSFLEQITAIDMISRILRLNDLLNNTQNFGFFVTEGKPPALKIIDFRISDDIHVDDEQFRGFLAGNGKYCYTSSHRTVRYGLHDRPVSNRVHAALHCLSQGSLRNFHQCIDQAHQDVLKFVCEAKEFAESVVPFSNQLAAFQVALHKNVNFFIDNLERHESCTLHGRVETFGDPKQASQSK
jgi:mannose-6-phosphate isomerase class I